MRNARETRLTVQQRTVQVQGEKRMSGGIAIRRSAHSSCDCVFENGKLERTSIGVRVLCSLNPQYLPGSTNRPGSSRIPVKTRCSRSRAFCWACREEIHCGSNKLYFLIRIPHSPDVMCSVRRHCINWLEKSVRSLRTYVARTQQPSPKNGRTSPKGIYAVESLITPSTENLFDQWLQCAVIRIWTGTWHKEKRKNQVNRFI